MQQLYCIEIFYCNKQSTTSLILNMCAIRNCSSTWCNLICTLNTHSSAMYYVRCDILYMWYYCNVKMLAILILHALTLQSDKHCPTPLILNMCAIRNCSSTWCNLICTLNTHSSAMYYVRCDILYMWYYCNVKMLAILILHALTLQSDKHCPTPLYLADIFLLTEEGVTMTEGMTKNQ